MCFIVLVLLWYFSIVAVRFIISHIMHYPLHFAIIPDGNRTRSKQQGLSVFEWYLQSVQVAITLIQHIFTTTPIEVFTGRGMSTDNLQKRPNEESTYLFEMYRTCGEELHTFFAQHHINFKRIGNPLGIPEDFLDYLQKMSQQFHFPESRKTVVFAVNYSGQDEILRGIQGYIADTNNNKKSQIEVSDISQYMDLHNTPPVDLIMRTKWNVSSRLSGFMSRRSSYAELYFTPKLYPEIHTKDIDEALVWFDSISTHRNFGK